MMQKLVLVFLLLALTIGITGYFYYLSQKHQLVRDNRDELLAIADLKVSQLVAWRKDLLNHAAGISKTNFFSVPVQQYFANPGLTANRRDILSWIRSLHEVYRFKNVLLVDTTGVVRLSTTAREGAIAPQALALLHEALRTKQVLLSDIHQGNKVNYVHLDLVAPLFLHQGSTATPVGGLIFHIDPQEFLYPLIQSWPTPSKTAETLLVRKEGNEVVFLNELRHRKYTALALRLPFTHRPRAAAMDNGEREAFEIRDYRNVPVLATMLAVPGTSWFLTSKIDLKEIYAPLRTRAWMVALAIVLLIAAAGLTILFWWRQKNAEHLRTQMEAESERRTLSRRYDNLSKHANDIILLVDHGQNGKIVDINERAVAVYGYPREELLRMTVRDLRAPEAAAEVDGQLLRIREQNGFMFETMHRRKDGTTFSVEVSSRFADIDGKQYYLGVVRDISERKRAEEALIREKNKFEAIVAAIGDGISIQDRDYKILYQNENHRGLVGDHIGEYCYQAYERRESACKGCPLALTFEDGAVHREERTINGRRGRISIEITTSPLRDAGGRIVAGIEAVRDITPRKEAEQAQNESEKRYKRLVESVTDYIYSVKVEQGRAVSTTHGPGCQSVTGYTAEEFSTNPTLWYRIIHEEDRPAVVDYAARTLSGHPVQSFVHRIFHKDGSLRWIRNTPVPRFDKNGCLTEYDGLITDVTELKRLEGQLRQAQKMEAVGQLAGGVAHDFNNILTAIIGYGNLILMKLPNLDPLRAYVDQILASSERAAHLTHSLLAFSRKQIIDLKPVDLNRIMQRVESLLVRLIGEDIELKVSLREGEIPVLADSIQIEQVLMNLATNARDAMPGGGRLAIETGIFEMGEDFLRAHSYGKAGTYGLITMTDSGMGMDEKTREKIFEPFFTTKDVGKGTGLGLAMAYGIIKQHNGYINVYSEPGKGTTFKVYLPLTLSAATAAQGFAAPLPQRGAETLLLAEDDDAVRKLTKTVLEDFGYEIIEAVDGEEAVRKFRENRERIAMLLLDIVMPKRNGKEVYQEIKKERPGIRALFTSGYTADVIHKKGILDDGLDFILKPVSPTDLLKKVREVLDRPNAE